MTKIELNAFRSVLESRQTDLGNASRNREALAFETSPDELDRIQRASDRDLAIDNLARDSSQLAEVRSALHRVNAGTFGFCLGCEEKINPKRLAVVPWASFCLVCQEALDREKAPWGDIDTSFAMAA
jgi:DnaK suppressor protein